MKKIAKILFFVLITALLSCEEDDYKTEIFNDNLIRHKLPIRPDGGYTDSATNGLSY